jgi:YD repeat-containing protein
VGTSQHGSGTSNTRKEKFNAYGQVTRLTDERGVITDFAQTEQGYDAAGNAIQVTRRERFHNATDAGELTTPGGAQPKARVYYTAI